MFMVCWLTGLAGHGLPRFITGACHSYALILYQQTIVNRMVSARAPPTALRVISVSKLKKEFITIFVWIGCATA